MTTTILSFRLLHLFGTRYQDAVTIEFSGRADDFAHGVLIRALAEAGAQNDGVTGFTLSMRDDVYSEDGRDNQFLVLSGEETLEDLRVVIGADDEAVVLRSGGFGGPDLGEVMLWTVNDLWPHLSAVLEVYGAVDVARRVGRVVEARKNRQTRHDAAYWIRSGEDAPQEYLLQAVLASSAWSDKAVERIFGLTGAEAARLMRACGYAWNPVVDEYYYAGGEPL